MSNVQISVVRKLNSLVQKKIIKVNNKISLKTKELYNLLCTKSHQVYGLFAAAASALVLLRFSSLKTKVMRVALLMTQKRIMAKTSGGQSIDADIKPARLIGYCRILAAHNAEHFFLLLVRFNPGKFFYPCWLEFSNSTFFIFFTFLLLGCSFMLESGFLLLPIFHRSSRSADILYMYTDSGNVACDLILFRTFFRRLPSALFV